MKHFLFDPVMSFWQYIVMLVAVLVAALLEYSPLGALAFFLIVIAGGIIEGVVEAVSKP